MIKTKIKCKVMKKFLIGIDISKEKFDVTVIKSLGEGFECEQVHYDVYDNKVRGYSAMLKDMTTLGVRCGDSLFCMETTGAYELHLCDYLYGKGTTYGVSRHCKSSGLRVWQSRRMTKRTASASPDMPCVIRMPPFSMSL